MAGSGDKLPQRCGRYVLFERLGGGGMADVYKARIAQRTGPERILVIKLLPAGFGKDEAARFIEEAKIALPLTHGNITATFEFDRHEGRPFLVMEYVHGRSLRQILTRTASLGREVGMAEALFLCREVARALRYAHNLLGLNGLRSPIVHRDVSPENVLVSYGGQVKLADFGIARSVEALDTAGAWGKPAYVAPEILEGDPGGPASDVYSLACVLYEVLAGWPPLLASSEAETLERVRSVRPEPLSAYRDDLPEGLGELVATALEKQPRDRKVDAAQLEVSLSRLLGNVAPHFTESDLAATMARLFERELREEAGDADAALAARIREQLSEAGLATSGSETAKEMLAMGTVVLSDASTPPQPALDGSSRRGQDVGLAIPVEAPAAAPGRPSRPSRPPDLGEPSAGGALLATALGLGALIIGGIVAFVVYGRTPGDDGAARDGAVAVAPADAEPSGGDALEAGAGADGGSAPAVGVDAGGERRDGGKKIPPRRRHATVSFTSVPWSFVWVDGSKLPGHTPIKNVKLRAGTHRVRFHHPGPPPISKSTTIRLSAGEERVVGIRLSE